MKQPSVAGGESRTSGGRSTLRRAALLVIGFSVSYGLVLSVLSDTFFWFAIPGMLGLATVVILALQMLLYRPFGGAVKFATDGTDREGPVKYHYTVLVRRYLLIAEAGIAMVVLPLMFDIRYLGPFIAVGLLSLLLGTKFWLPQLGLAWKCARVLKVYEFEFRSPVQKSNLHAKGRRSLTLGDDGSPRMSAREPLHSDRWPKEIARGVWFAGDDVFGGVLLVPDTGELMFCSQRAGPSIRRHDSRPERNGERRPSGPVSHESRSRVPPPG